MKSIGETIAIGRTFKGKPAKMPALAGGSIQHRYPIFFKPLIGGDNCPVIQLGRRNDEAVKRVVVDRRQFRRCEADIQSEGKNGQSVMFGHLLEPRFNGMRKFQPACGSFEADFKSADSRDINRWGSVDFLERGAA